MHRDGVGGTTRGCLPSRCRSRVDRRTLRTMTWQDKEEVALSITVTNQSEHSDVRTERRLSAAIAALIALDAVFVGAPGLAVFALPFAIVAWRYRGRHRVATIAALLWCVLWVIVGVNFMLGNGLHEPREAGKSIETINIGDFLSVYLGTPLTAWLTVRLATRRLRRRP